MAHLFAALEIDERTGKRRYYYRPRVAAEVFPHLGTYASIRKRIQLRHTNGLLTFGAVIECRLGILIDPDKYQAWLLQPRQGSEAA